MAQAIPSARRPLRLVIVLTVALLVAVGVGLQLTPPYVAPIWGAPGATGLWAIGFLLVGRAVDRSRPGHPVGRRLLVAALFSAVTYMAAEVSYESSWLPSSWRGLGATTSSWTWASAAAAMATAALRFPHGRLPSPRWRWVEGSLWGVVALMSAATFLTPQTVEGVPANPFGLAGAEVLIPLSMAGDVVYAPLQIVLALCLAAPFVRYRSAPPDDRSQLRLLGVATALIAIVIVAVEVVLLRVAGPALAQAGTWITSLLIPLVPAVMGTAILRYRLYDVDHVVSRTVAYATVTAILVGVYAGLVVGLQTGLRPLTEGSDLAVAASTLAVAGLFRPVRDRVQRGVDRRFNRARYDAVRAVERFGLRLRNEVDLERISGHLQAAVSDTVAPRSVTVWTVRTPSVTAAPPELPR